MKMVRHQRPGVAFTSGLPQASLKPGDELLPVSVIQKYIAPLSPARNNMIYCSGNLYPFMSWHGVEVSFLPLSCQVDSVPIFRAGVAGYFTLRQLGAAISCAETEKSMI